MSSGAANNPNPNVDNALLHHLYDPITQGTTGQFLNKFTIPVSGFQDEQTGHLYTVVHLTAKGDQALFDLCHNNVCTARPLYVNTILIASYGIKTHNTCSMNTHSIFGEYVQIPGYWNSACAGCKWKDGRAHCDFYADCEPKYMLLSVAELPHAPIKELED
ncbi:hypothetical protein BDW71DRAFT_212886 [Aspergillus fruticulosus]